MDLTERENAEEYPARVPLESMSKNEYQGYSENRDINYHGGSVDFTIAI